MAEYMEKRFKKTSHRNFSDLKALIAFTLAEVLIVLGIIGVIAAITIPTLLQNAEESQAKASVKVAYSILTQAMTQIISQNSGSIVGICEDWDGACFKNMFKDVLKYVKECDTLPITNKCWIANNFSDGTYYGVDGTSPGGMGGAVLQNGMLMLFRYHKKDCSLAANWACGWIGVDINGFKKPNRWGKDVFMFSVGKEIIKPAGVDGDTGNFRTCNSTDTGDYSGWGCTAKYLYEN